MKARKPALMAATLALAIAPALTAITPAHAAPRASLVVAAADPSIKELIIAVFPEPMATNVRAILDGDLAAIFTVLGDALNLTPAQLTEIFTKLQALIGQLGIPTTPTTPTPEPTTPVPAPEAPAPAAYSVVKPLNAQETKAVKQLKAQLKKVDGKKLTQRQAADLALTIATVFGK